VRFLPDFNEHYRRAWAAVPEGWKSIRYGWNVHRDKPVPVNTAIHRPPSDGAGMYAHLWNQAGMNRFYDHIWHLRKLGIDGAMVDLRRREPKDWYQTSQQIIGLDPLRTVGRDE